MKLRIASQKAYKLFERTFVPELIDDGLHLGSDAPPFAQADFVNLPGGYIGGFVQAHGEAVPGLAFTTLPEAAFNAACGQGMFYKTFLQLAESSKHGCC